MKTGIYILIAIASVLGACRDSKEVVSNDEPPIQGLPSNTDENMLITGTVKLSPECGVTIRVVQGDVMKYYHPVSLPEKFTVEGMKLQMNYAEVMAKMPAGCEYLTPISVTNVREVK